MSATVEKATSKAPKISDSWGSSIKSLVKFGFACLVSFALMYFALMVYQIVKDWTTQKSQLSSTSPVSKKNKKKVCFYDCVSNVFNLFKSGDLSKSTLSTSSQEKAVRVEANKSPVTSVVCFLVPFPFILPILGVSDKCRCFEGGAC